MKILIISFFLSLAVISAWAEEARYMVTVRGPADLSKSLGMDDFCAEGEPLCEVSAPVTIKLAGTMFWLLMRVQRDVNVRIDYLHQGPRRLGPLRWGKGVDVGDCREYVVAKWEELLKAGVPLGAMSIAIAKIPGVDKMYHAVLVIQTDHGDYILDHLQGKRVIPFFQAKYKAKDKAKEYIWVLKTKPGNPLIWGLVGKKVSS